MIKLFIQPSYAHFVLLVFRKYGNVDYSRVAELVAKNRSFGLIIDNNNNITIQTHYPDFMMVQAREILAYELAGELSFKVGNTVLINGTKYVVLMDVNSNNYICLSENKNVVRLYYHDGMWEEIISVNLEKLSK